MSSAAGSHSRTVRACTRRLISTSRCGSSGPSSRPTLRSLSCAKTNASRASSSWPSARQSPTRRADVDPPRGRAMTLPFAFLLGLAVVFGSRELIPPIPGNGRPEQLLPFAALLCLPSLLVACSSWWLRQNLIRGRRGRVPPRTMLRISALATPLVLWLLFAEGGYGDFVERWVGGSHFATNMCLMLPVLAAELP